LGDAAPPDLLIFSWLRDRLPIQYVGLTDQLLLQCGVELRDNLTVQLAESEIAALPLVAQCLGDLPTHLGEWCSGLLFSGRQICVEALISFAAWPWSELEAALLGRDGRFSADRLPHLSLKQLTASVIAIPCWRFESGICGASFDFKVA